jgi:hypothetical protein
VLTALLFAAVSPCWTPSCYSGAVIQRGRAFSATVAGYTVRGSITDRKQKMLPFAAMPVAAGSQLDAEIVSSDGKTRIRTVGELGHGQPGALGRVHVTFVKAQWAAGDTVVESNRDAGTHLIRDAATGRLRGTVTIDLGERIELSLPILVTGDEAAFDVGRTNVGKLVRSRATR